MHTNYQNILLCALEDCESLSIFLSQLCISKNKQKLFIKNKKYLRKKIIKKDVLEIPIDLLNINMVWPKYTGDKVIKIVDNHLFLALSKPARVHSLPLRYNESNNLISFVREQEKSAEVFSINKDTYEKGLLYRLDYETSGLILLARNKLFYEAFRTSLEKKKFYLAVVEGEIENDFSYAHHIGYSGEKGAVGRVSNEALKNSHLEGKKIIYDKEKNLSLVVIKLIEGKRHQIRIQLSHEGHPIVGDPIYGNHGAKRMYLHSFCYQFLYLNKEYKIVDNNFHGLEIIFNTNRVFQMADEAILSF